MNEEFPSDQERKRKTARFNHVLAMVTSLLLLGVLLAGGVIGVWGLIKMLRHLF